MNNALPELVVCGRCAKFYSPELLETMSYTPDTAETRLDRIEDTLNNHVLSTLEAHGGHLEALEVGQQGLQDAVSENSRKLDLLCDHFRLAP
ncbi:MAG: hypothetical protein OXG69_07845 [bacterium]|nr:hypothetical protein [bacterium]